MFEQATTEVAPVSRVAAGPVPDGSSEAGRLARIDWFADRFDELHTRISDALVGEPGIVRLALVCVTAGGHLLIDDVPGVGKTSLARSVAAASAGSVKRIQCTTDLLPSDITGTQVWNPGTREFEFRPGPVFANVVVVDEINRMPPRSQSALLEVMEEGHVTVDGTAWPVPSPFVVVATQNPVEYESTFALPEAQLDRFLMRVTIGYPSPEDEVDIALRTASSRNRQAVAPVADPATIRQMVDVRSEVHVSRPVARYCVDLCEATRRLPGVRLGAGPRGSAALVCAGQAWAGAARRAYVTPDHVKAVAPSVLAHRLVPVAGGDWSHGATEALVREVLAAVPVPRHRPEG